MKSILLIDDEPGVLTALQLMLKGFGYTVTAYTNPQEAVASLENSIPDIILCDLRMPELDGKEVLLHCQQSCPEVPFILMSGHATDKEVQEMQNLGISGYLPKPFTGESIQKVLRDL